MRPDRTVLSFSRIGLAELLDQSQRISAEDDHFDLAIDVRLKRIGGESRLIIRGRGQRPPEYRQDPVLIDALVQAHAWGRAFLETPGTSISAITNSSEYSPAYTYRLLPLAFLAQAILGGTQPRGLSLKKLLRGVPAAWVEQRETFGFPHLQR